MRIIKTGRCVFLISISFIITVIVIPLLINEAYKINQGYTTLWGASDVLSFYSVILSGLITIVALIVTIRFSKKETDRQILFSQSQTNAPFFIVDKVNKKDTVSSNGEIMWKEVKWRTRGTDVQMFTIISLKNIGTGIAIAPHYKIGLPSSSYEGNTEYVLNGDYIDVKYNLDDLLGSKFNGASWPGTNENLKVCITLSYQNALGIEYIQELVIEYVWLPEINTFKASINNISYQKIKLT